MEKAFSPRPFTFHLLPKVFRLAFESLVSYTFVEGKPLHRCSAEESSIFLGRGTLLPGERKAEQAANAFSTV